MAEIDQPIIIKKITIDGGGHHGGAWKVAYADFVTAMMAFFLLLWLLSAASEETKEGLSEYFTPTVGISGAEGIGFQGGQTMTEDGTQISDKTPVAIVSGRAPQGSVAGPPEKQSLIEAEEEAKLFEMAAEEIKKAFEEDEELQGLKENVVVEETNEGLKIEMLDSDIKSMFKSGGVELSVFGEIILGRISEIVQRMPNYISIIGHTDSAVSDSAKYTNWELSTDRANSARRFLISTYMQEDRVAKVLGRADRELLLPEMPLSPRNRRITVILLKGAHMMIPLSRSSATRSLLSVPKIRDIKQGNEKPTVAEEYQKIQNPDFQPAEKIEDELILDEKTLSQPADGGEKQEDDYQLPTVDNGDSNNGSDDNIESEGTIH